ncbi:MAG: hypothetical protein N3F64_02605 [Nitrososphaeria archaeon]|nr:hypothetical protein [Nitrososphaeria archaeon]
MKTGLEAFDEILGGGIPQGVLLQVFGEKAVGKSIFSSQLAYKNLEQGANSLIIDTEQGFKNTIGSYWHERFKNRFKLDCGIQYVSFRRFALRGRERKVFDSELKSLFEAALSSMKINYTRAQLEQACWPFLEGIELEYTVNDKPTLYVIEAPALQDILAFNGVRCDILISESGRVEIRLLPGTTFKVSESVLGKFVQEANISLLVYDSISMPLKSTFIGTQDFPGRSSATALILGQTQKLCSELKISVIALNHVTVNPITGQNKPYGGQIVGYDFKFSFMLERAYSSIVNDKTIVNSGILSSANRVLRVHRHPSIPEYSLSIALKLGDDGFFC